MGSGSLPVGWVGQIITTQFSLGSHFQMWRLSAKPRVGTSANHSYHRYAADLLPNADDVLHIAFHTEHLFTENLHSLKTIWLPKPPSLRKICTLSKTTWLPKLPAWEQSLPMWERPILTSNDGGQQLNPNRSPTRTKSQQVCRDSSPNIITRISYFLKWRGTVHTILNQKHTKTCKKRRGAVRGKNWLKICWAAGGWVAQTGRGVSSNERESSLERGRERQRSIFYLF